MGSGVLLLWVAADDVRSCCCPVALIVRARPPRVLQRGVVIHTRCSVCPRRTYVFVRRQGAVQDIRGAPSSCHLKPPSVCWEMCGRSGRATVALPATGRATHNLTPPHLSTAGGDHTGVGISPLHPLHARASLTLAVSASFPLPFRHPLVGCHLSTSPHSCSPSRRNCITTTHPLRLFQATCTIALTVCRCITHRTEQKC